MNCKRRPSYLCFYLFIKQQKNNNKRTRLLKITETTGGKKDCSNLILIITLFLVIEIQKLIYFLN